MWLKIAGIAKAAGCKLSVYIDDITLSGPAVPESLVWEIKKQIHSRGLVYHKQRRCDRRQKPHAGPEPAAQKGVAPAG